MLDISLTVEGDKIIIEGLKQFAEEMPGAVQRGLGSAGKKIYDIAFQWLSGAGAYYKASKSGKSRRKVMDTASGGYPVPVRTGWLRRELSWLYPGKTKTYDTGTFTAGPNEVIIYNAAEYANVVHEGKGSSAKFGPRRFLTDAFEMFNRGLGIQMAISDEIQKAKAKAGLK